MRIILRSPGWWVALSLSLLLASCGGDSTTPSQPVPISISLSANSLTVLQDGTPASVTVTVVRPSGNANAVTLSVTAVGAASAQGGTVILGRGFVTFTPPSGYAGQDQFTYTLSDGCNTVQGTVSVTITPASAPSQNLSAITLTATCADLLFDGIPGLEYVVQWASALTGPWTDLSGTLTADAIGEISYSDCRSPRPPSAFYRTRVGP